MPISAKIPWDVESFDVSPDGARIAYASNEDGFSVLHVVDAATLADVALPALPRGVMSDVHFQSQMSAYPFGSTTRRSISARQ